MRKGCFEKKILAFLMAIAISISLIACGNTGESAKESSNSTVQQASQSTESMPSKEPVTLKIYTNAKMSNYGIQKNPVAEEIEKATGVTMDFVANPSEETLKIMLAGGDLPDIISLSATVYAKQLIEGSNIIAMDDLLKTNGKDIVSLNPKRVEFSKKYLSNNAGKVYLLPYAAIASTKQIASDFSYECSAIRWDYYKELGCPEINNWDDLISVLAQMQKNHPKTQDGRKIYGLGAFTDWGTFPFTGLHSYGNNANSSDICGHTVYVDKDGNIKQTYNDENSIFWQSMRDWNKAYKANIVDPDSFTQKWANFSEKGNNGQYLFEPFNWQFYGVNVKLAKEENPEAGFVPIYTVFPYVSRISLTAIGDAGGSVGITSKCKAPDRAMDLINFFATYEGCRMLWSGVKGTHWDIENGKPEFKDEVFEKKSTDATYLENEGIGKYTVLAAWYGNAIDPNDGVPMDLTKTTKAYKKLITPLEKSFNDFYKVDYPGQLCDKLVAEGTISFRNNIFVAARGALGYGSDDIKRIDTQIVSYISKEIPKLIMAKTDTDFSNEYKTTIEELEKLGLKTSVEYWTKEFNRCMSIAVEFKP
ncbi:MAG TPA: hypothetical protein PK733_02890 [Clostridiales bacterium]|nr:hypothetical protein [Clostridiales bacterium]